MKKAIAIVLVVLLGCLNCAQAEMYPEGVLYRGIKGHRDEVEFLQYQLFYAGFLGDDINAVDGIYGKKTENAVKAYQEARGFFVDGVAWPEVQAQLDVEWERSMEPQDGWEEPYSYCYTDYHTNGSAYIVLCSKHMETSELAAQTLDRAYANDEQTIAALKTNIQLWQEKMDEQYELQIALCAEAYKPIWLNHKAAFMNFYSAKMALWNARYGTDSMAALEKACMALSDHCIEMCCEYGNMP